VISFQTAGTSQEGADNSANESNIQLILGSYRSGKTDLILDGVLKQCKDRTLTETIIVVPSERYRSLLEKRIHKLSKRQPDQGQESAGITGGIIGLRILTFYQYCRLLLNRAGIFLRTLPDSVRPRIIQILLEEAKNNQSISALAKIANNPGAPQAVLDLIDELQRAALSPSEVIARLERTAGRDTPQLAYATLYDQYWQTLDRIDYLDEHRLAYKILELSGPEQLTFAPELVAIDGFDRFNPLQLQVIAASSRLCKQIVISFDYLPAQSDPKGEYEWKRKTYQQLIAALHPVESLQPSKSIANRPLQAFSSGDRYLEMSQISAMVKEAILQRSVSRDEILVVIPRISDYAEAAEAAFHDAGIDCFVDAPIKLNAQPIVRFLLTLCSLKEDSFARPAVISSLKSAFFNLKELGLSERDVTRLDLVSYKEKIISGEQQWLVALEEEPFNLQGKIEKLFRIFDRAPKSGSAHAFVGWVEDLLDKLMILPNDEHPGEPALLWQVRAAVGKVRECLASLLSDQDILEVLGDRIDHKYKVHLDKFKNLIEKENFPRPPASKETVLISTGETAPNRSYDEVYITGLVEGDFPRRPVRGGLLTGDEILIWESHGVTLHNPRFEPGFEVALLTGLKERARKRIVMSTPKFDMNGEELTPAFSFTEQIDNGSAAVLDTEYFQSQLTLPTSARNALTGAAWCASADYLASTQQPQISELRDGLGEARLSARARDESNLNSPYNGCLKEQTSAGTLKIGLPELFSASQLGTFGSCPHQYWLSHVLRARVLEEPQEGLDARERGSAYHKALEIFYGKLISQTKGIADLNLADLDALAESSVSECILEIESKPTFRGGDFWHYQKLELAFRIKQSLRSEQELANRSDQQFRPVAVEASFGYSDEAPPLQITGGQRPIFVRGRIDRIDEAIGFLSGSNLRLRVIDYKTGHTAISMKDQLRGTDLQLPLYALAVQRSIYRGSSVIEGKYWSVHACKPVGSLFPKRRDNEIQENPLENCERKVGEFVHKIAEGNFIVAPATTSECSFCDHKTICRIGELSKERKENDETD
jgi:ATP-dependent helicase/DNAse subunit B